jgi:hypothetical protein
MAYKLAEAYVEFSQKGVNAVRSGVDRIKGSFASAASSANLLAAGVAAIGTGVAVRGLWSFVEAAAEAERQTAKLAAVLASTGGVSGQTVASLEAHASALQKVTAFEDDTVKGAQAVLLTFKKIAGDTFPRATEAALDLATVFEGDLKGAAMMVGKALEDPVRGITALRRAGVSFTKDQQEVIKSLVETGKAAEAQGMILKEISSQVGGAARKVGETTAGQVAQFKNAVGDVAEAIGVELLPAVKAAADYFKGLETGKFGRMVANAKAELAGVEADENQFGKIGKRMREAESALEYQQARDELEALLARKRVEADAERAEADSSWNWWTKSANERDAMKARANATEKAWEDASRRLKDETTQRGWGELPEVSPSTIEAKKKAEFQALKEQGRQKEAEWFGQRALGTMKEFESLKNVDFDSLKKIEAQNAHMVRIQEQQRDYLRDIAGMAALKEITDQMARFE